jgi:cell wall-associated NlpC family hydrolase
MGKVAIAEGLEVKQLLIDKAREQVTNGAHYLWGTAGATPGGKDGASYRPGDVNLQKNVPDLDQDGTQTLGKGPPYSPTLYSAWAQSGKTQYVCTGRAIIDSVAKLPFAVANLKLADALRLSMKKLTPAQIDELKKNSGSRDSYRWPRQVSPLNVEPGDISTVWGESCVGKRHFDCIGLINYLFSNALNRQWAHSIGDFTGGSLGTSVSITKAEAGDILTIDSEHIGIVTFKGTAIDAREPNQGVVENPVSSTKWTNCYRLPASEWKPGPS